MKKYRAVIWGDLFLLFLLSACANRGLLPLPSLKFSNISSIPDFTGGQIFQVEVPFEIKDTQILCSVSSSVNVYYKLEDEKMQLMENGTWTEKISLSLGQNCVQIFVVSHGKLKEYEIRILRRRRSNALLSSLEIDGVKLTPDFDGENKEYELFLPYRMKQMKLRAFPVSEDAEMKASLNGDKWSSLKQGEFVFYPINTGVNHFQLRVEHPDDISVDYFLRIVRYEDADLAEVWFSHGKIEPELTPWISSYTVYIPEYYDDTLFSPVLKDRRAAIRVYERELPQEPIVQEEEAFLLPLLQPVHQYIAVVKAVDGFQRYYRFTVRKENQAGTDETFGSFSEKQENEKQEISNEVYLERLQIQAVFKYEYDLKLTPNFNSFHQNYEAFVNEEVKKIKVVPTAFPLDASIKMRVNRGNYQEVTSGFTTTLPIRQGRTNQLQIVVSEKGETAVYTVVLKVF